MSKACRITGLSRSSWYQLPQDNKDRDQQLIDALNEVVNKHRRWGFWKCYHRLRNQGHLWNHKRVYRIYCELELNLPRRTKKRVPKREAQPLEVISLPNKMWSMDFVHDSLYRGRCFRTLNAIDEGVREALAIEVLDAHLFDDLETVRDLSWKWMISYNEERPHAALNNLTPSQYSNLKLSA